MSQPITAKFVKDPVQVADDYICPVCRDHDISENGPFLAHQTVQDVQGLNSVTYDGSLHPIHQKCIKTWLKHSHTCPSCRVPIKNMLVSRSEKIVNLMNRGINNAREGARELAGPMIFGAATLALIGATELTGIRGAKDILAIGGCGYGIATLFMGALYGSFGTDMSSSKVGKFGAIGSALGAITGIGLWQAGLINSEFTLLHTMLGFGGLSGALGALASPFFGTGNRDQAGAPERISTTAKWGAFGGTFIGTVAWFFGKTQDMRLAQVLGIIAIAKSTGLTPSLMGGAIGGLTAALSWYFMPNLSDSWTRAAATSATALALHVRNHTPIIVTGMSARFGFTAAKMIGKTLYDYLGKAAGLAAIGAVAGATAAIGSTLLTRAYRSYYQQPAVV